jgi:lipoate-protein ligase A
VYFLDLTLPTPEENLALDEALLQTAELNGFECLRVWEVPQTVVVLGKNCRVGEDVCISRCQADGISVLRRCSGGGTVLLGPGCLNYSAVLRYDRAPGLNSVTTSMRYCLGRMQVALTQGDVRVEIFGSDLVSHGRKFGGSAQRRQLSHFLHHGTILYQFDISLISHYLKEPIRQPQHRARRDHATFLTCLPVNRRLLTDRLRETWKADDSLDATPLELTANLVATRYGLQEWHSGTGKWQTGK